MHVKGGPIQYTAGRNLRGRAGDGAGPCRVHGRGVELCSINPAYQGKEYRYVYACGTQRPCNFFNSLTKIDIVKKEAKNWYEPGSVPSEPFFVARPGGTDEDDGKFELTEMYFFDVLSSI